MSMWTLVAALVSALVVWFLLVRQLTAQPWLVAGDAGPSVETGTPGFPVKKVGLYFFLAVVSSLFALFFTAYIMRMDPDHGSDWLSIPKPGILWLNTVLLFGSSAAMQWAKSSSHTLENKFLRGAIALAGILALLFLGGQLLAWQQLDQISQQLSNPALGFFYLLTGIHALHLAGGLFVWARAFIRIMAGVNTPSIKLSIELCTVYWHYLLLVWLVLFGLLLNT